MDVVCVDVHLCSCVSGILTGKSGLAQVTLQGSATFSGMQAATGGRSG